MIRWILLLILLGAAAAGGFYLHMRLTVPSDERRIQATVAILRSEELAFLAVEREHTLSVVEIRENDPIFGGRHGTVMAEIAVVYGFDLKKISAKDVTVEKGRKLRIQLPPPEVLSCSVEPSSIRYYTKLSGLQFLRDQVIGRNLRDELNRELALRGIRSIRARGSLPDRAKLIRRFNFFLGPLFEKQQIKVVFE
ncbi:MAG: DUF4230 domain-containing protein [Victivallaceae bacterium]|nr:DUF4230 domain-containing protein [Victivallaceae bacterium]